LFERTQVWDHAPRADAREAAAGSRATTARPIGSTCPARARSPRTRPRRGISRRRCCSIEALYLALSRLRRGRNLQLASSHPLSWLFGRRRPWSRRAGPFLNRIISGCRARHICRAPRDLVDVDLGNRDPLAKLVRNLLERGADHLAGPAPFRQKSTSSGAVGAEDVGVEGRIGDRFGGHVSVPLGCSRCRTGLGGAQRPVPCICCSPLKPGLCTSSWVRDISIKVGPAV